MLILAGPAKVDLLFGHPHQPAAPWQVNASTLAGIDDHFWDWALWLRSKLARRDDLVPADCASCTSTCSARWELPARRRAWATRSPRTSRPAGNGKDGSGRTYREMPRTP
jgi:hypothetical protein